MKRQSATKETLTLRFSKKDLYKFCRSRYFDNHNNIREPYDAMPSGYVDLLIESEVTKFIFGFLNVYKIGPQSNNMPSNVEIDVKTKQTRPEPQRIENSYMLYSIEQLENLRNQLSGKINYKKENNFYS